MRGQEKMSYRCQNPGCDAVVPPGYKAMRKVTVTRFAVYPNGSTGREIAEELFLCHSCMGLPVPPASWSPPVYVEPDDKPATLFELVLGNGKSCQSNSGFELACFLNSDGVSIVPPKPKPKKKGKKKKTAKADKPQDEKKRQPRHLT